jgi:hypothetical protein
VTTASELIARAMASTPHTANCACRCSAWWHARRPASLKRLAERVRPANQVNHSVDVFDRCRTPAHR